MAIAALAPPPLYPGQFPEPTTDVALSNVDIKEEHRWPPSPDPTEMYWPSSSNQDRFAVPGTEPTSSSLLCERAFGSLRHSEQRPVTERSALSHGSGSGGSGYGEYGAYGGYGAAKNPGLGQTGYDGNIQAKGDGPGHARLGEYGIHRHADPGDCVNGTDYQYHNDSRHGHDHHGSLGTHIACQSQGPMPISVPSSPTTKSHITILMRSRTGGRVIFTEDPSMISAGDDIAPGNEAGPDITLAPPSARLDTEPTTPTANACGDSTSSEPGEDQCSTPPAPGLDSPAQPEKSHRPHRPPSPGALITMLRTKKLRKPFKRRCSSCERAGTPCPLGGEETDGEGERDGQGPTQGDGDGLERVACSSE